ncbi:MAG: hypothetical protein ACKVT1_12410, partial [Dehalococcoidia bacterium]
MLRRLVPGSLTARLAIAMAAVPVLAAGVTAFVASAAAERQADTLFTASELPEGALAGIEVSEITPGSLVPGSFTVADDAHLPPLQAVPVTSLSAGTAFSSDAPVSYVEGVDGQSWAIVGAVPFSAVYASDRNGFVSSINRTLFATAGGAAALSVVA